MIEKKLYKILKLSPESQPILVEPTFVLMLSIGSEGNI